MLTALKKRLPKRAKQANSSATRGAAEAVISSNTNLSRTATARIPNQSDISRIERISVHDSLKDAFIPATLVSVAPENASETNENYPVQLNETDKLITKKSLENALQNADENFLEV